MFRESSSSFIAPTQLRENGGSGVMRGQRAVIQSQLDLPKLMATMELMAVVLDAACKDIIWEIVLVRSVWQDHGRLVADTFISSFHRTPQTPGLLRRSPYRKLFLAQDLKRVVVWRFPFLVILGMNILVFTPKNWRKYWWNYRKGCRKFCLLEGNSVSWGKRAMSFIFRSLDTLL